MSKLSRIAIFACALAACSSALAADWYVSRETGKNANDGKAPATPFKSLYKAIEAAAPGDSIRVAEGNYNGKMSCGWIALDKPLALIGGYSPDFAARDPAAHQAILRPSNKMNATKPMLGTLAIAIKAPGNLVIDGFVFDQGDANSYHPVNGKPEGVATGMWLQPPAKGNTAYPSIDKCMVYARTAGDVLIQNCVFANGSNYALNLGDSGGSVRILNNVFIANRMCAADITSTAANPGQVKFEFAFNTVLFTWSRTKELDTMGYGVRANRNVESSIHDNILGLNIGAGFDDTLGDAKTKKIKLDRNVFFLNRLADVTVTVSPSIKRMMVTDEGFEDLADCEGFESLQGNIALKDPKAFKGIIDPAYLEGFLSATYSEKTDVDEESPANVLREVFGLNKRGKIATKVSMFCNRYPLENVFKLFGTYPKAGAQPIK